MRLNEGTSDELRHGSSNTILVFAELWNDNAHHHAAITFIYILKWKIYTSFLGWFQCEYLSIYVCVFECVCSRLQPAVHLYIKSRFRCDLYIDSSFFVDSGCWLTIVIRKLERSHNIFGEKQYDMFESKQYTVLMIIKTRLSFDFSSLPPSLPLSRITDLFAIFGFDFPFSIRVSLMFYFRNIISVKFDCKQGNRKEHIIYYILLLLTI